LVEPPQELLKGICSGPLGALFGRVVAAPQSHRQWLVVATKFPAPSPRFGVRLLHDDMISGDRLHATIVRHCARLCQAKQATPHTGHHQKALRASLAQARDRWAAPSAATNRRTHGRPSYGDQNPSNPVSPNAANVNAMTTSTVCTAQ
jgi:hypothetical protein